MKSLKPLMVVAISCVTVFALAGCLGLVRGSNASVSVSSNPPGAMAQSSRDSCQTPCRLKVRRTGDTVTVSAHGYAPTAVGVFPMFNWGIWLVDFLLLGGIFSFLVWGNYNDPNPRAVGVNLRPYGGYPGTYPSYRGGQPAPSDQPPPPAPSTSQPPSDPVGNF